MRTTRLGFVLFAIALFLHGCSATASKNILRDDPAFVEGFDVGITMAQDDRVNMDCDDRRLGTQGARKARKCHPMWKAQGKSDSFVAGFTEGYKKRFRENAERICE